MSSGDMMTRMTKLDESKRLDPFRYQAGVGNGSKATAVVTYTTLDTQRKQRNYTQHTPCSIRSL